MPALVASLFLLGLASGVHCVAMCGGFVAAFQGIPIRKADAPGWRRLALLNAGRIASYALAGSVSGFMGSFVTAQTALYAAANVVLIAMGLHLAGVPLLNSIEGLGRPLWRRLQPWVNTRRSSFTLGLLWGWLPCGLVYGALAASAFAGSAAGGAAAMAAYGLGTAPWLMGAGAGAAFVDRRIAGAAVLALGAYGLAHAEGVAGGVRAILCL